MTDPAEDLALATPAVVRAADERRYVRQRCLEDVSRQIVPIGLLTLPLVAVTAMAISSEDAGRWLIAWIASSLVVELGVIIGLWRSRRPSATTERTERELSIAYGAVGAVWGLTTWVIDWNTSEHVSALLMLPLVMAVFMLVQSAALPRLFHATHASMLVVSVAGLLWAHTALTVVIAVSAAVWAVIAESMLRSMHASAIRAHQLTWRSDELVHHLRAERVRLAEANVKLAQQAIHDPLTGLLNRRGAMEALDGALLRLRDDDSAPHVGVLYLDLDLFKSVNDSLGHRAGDRLLEIMSARIQSALRSHDLAARVGGDELVVIVPQCTDPRHLQGIADRLRRSIGEPATIEGREMRVSASIGVSWAPDHGAVASDLLRSANEGLHRAKADGRDRVVTFDASLRAELDERARRERAIQRALVDGTVSSLFVPEFDAVTGMVVGAEIVAVHRGSNMILDLANLDPLATERVIMAAAESARAALDGESELPDGFRVRVTLPTQLGSRVFADQPIRALLSGLDARHLSVSMTDGLVRQDVTAAGGVIGALRAAGVHVTLDEVSTEASSLAVLRAATFDEIRIDRNAFDPSVGRPADRAIVRALVGIAQDLGMIATAVGVDTAQQATALTLLGCTRLQGRHLSGPVDAASLIAHARESARTSGAITGGVVR